MFRWLSYAYVYFLGAIGYSMAGSSLKELLYTAYVDKMLNSHAYARALCTHFLMHEALGVEIMNYAQLRENNQLNSLLDHFFDELVNIYDIKDHAKVQRLCNGQIVEVAARLEVLQHCGCSITE